MKTHPDDRAAYARKKFLLAELCDHDRRLYAEVKAVALDGFFQRILEQQEQTRILETGRHSTPSRIQ